MAAIEAELRSWDAYLECLQVKAATSAASAREQAEASISELRRHRNTLAQRLSEMRSAPAQAETEARKAVEVARDQLQRTAAQLPATAERGPRP